MNSVTKRIALLTASVATAGVLAFGQPAEEASAATNWQARTVEEVSTDMQAAADGGTTYTIQWGDTLAVIAQALDVDMNVLATINNISNVNQISVNNTISVSADDSTVTYTDPSGQSESYDAHTAQPEETQPVQEAPAEEPVQEEPVQEEPVQQEVQTQQAAPVQQTSNQSYSSNVGGSEADAKEWIAQRESNGSYTAVNGQYWGRYQLNPTLVAHGAGPAEQEAAADKYVSDRYGSWTNAQQFWMSNGWY